jgi:hypothetical protein
MTNLDPQTGSAQRAKYVQLHERKTFSAWASKAINLIVCPFREPCGRARGSRIAADSVCAHGVHRVSG